MKNFSDWEILHFFGYFYPSETPDRTFSNSIGRERIQDFVVIGERREKIRGVLILALLWPSFENNGSFALQLPKVVKKWDPADHFSLFGIPKPLQKGTRCWAHAVPALLARSTASYSSIYYQKNIVCSTLMWSFQRSVTLHTADLNSGEKISYQKIALYVMQQVCFNNK